MVALLVAPMKLKYEKTYRQLSEVGNIDHNVYTTHNQKKSCPKLQHCYNLLHNLGTEELCGHHEKYSGVAIKMSLLKSQWRKFQGCQLWKPSEISKIDILLWKFYHSIIFKLIVCMPNFKSKRFTKKKLFKIYQHG